MPTIAPYAPQIPALCASLENGSAKWPHLFHTLVTAPSGPELNELPRYDLDRIEREAFPPTAAVCRLESSRIVIGNRMAWTALWYVNESETVVPPQRDYRKAIDWFRQLAARALELATDAALQFDRASVAGEIGEMQTELATLSKQRALMMLDSCRTSLDNWLLHSYGVSETPVTRMQVTGLPRWLRHSPTPDVKRNHTRGKVRPNQPRNALPCIVCGGWVSWAVDRWSHAGNVWQLSKAALSLLAQRPSRAIDRRDRLGYDLSMDINNGWKLIRIEMNKLDVEALKTDGAAMQAVLRFADRNMLPRPPRRTQGRPGRRRPR